MPTDYISFKDTGFFSKLIGDYLSEKEELRPFYNNFPKLENFKLQMEAKQKTISNETRLVLANALQSQYKNTETTSAVSENIAALRENNTFTVTTGHQLNLFTGPLYFLYKIVSTINLAKELKTEYPKANVVPVYWMATEDHDFEEINYFNFNGKKIRWNKDASGAVGELNTEGLEPVFNLFSKELGLGDNANTLRDLFKKAYLEHDNLAEATRFLANELFKDYGLVIIDANSKTLKQEFAPYIKQELLKQTAFQEVTKTSGALSAVDSDYTLQVTPREINLFYNIKNVRERIIFENDSYKALNTQLCWTEEELLKEVDTHPEHFSPNVILRPLYQEVILPNLCYIGGGGELAYWFQLHDNFKANGVVFPMLLMRNSAVIKTVNQSKKQQQLAISNQDLFLKRNTFINKRVREISNIEIDFSEQIQLLKTQFKELYAVAEHTDKSFVGAVSAQEKKQINGLQHLEKRLLTAQKRKLKDAISRATAIQNELFPNENLQERITNFSQLYEEFGDTLIPKLLQELHPLNDNFVILEL
ncbi:bacillithiol biosynthesis cysteine-adding enzyme BshC [Bizionia gelidisalsuginis]|uniref:Putative cysteine ligase BshC n=1 Tax=Bizionia gelidisalsuginis TaxID=291188 RepID=A0ABY3MDH2_9FLAO|nr:bacillithiol biosynthesis cysteine-adding enzyme BshC [Bizionia gelidisalsuginis]TYC17050.1 bacillithiol biosynthesis cysteine-adding enzyme BshC [Bizionia gelidisalsuginis]